MGKQLCLVTPVLAGSLGCHIPNCSWTVGLEADVGVKSSPACFLWVENDLQSWSRKFWDILPNLAGDEEQRRTHGPWWPLILNTGLVSSSCLILSSLGGLAL